jgi:thiol:disulfide interchange protein DsbC
MTRRTFSLVCAVIIAFLFMAYPRFSVAQAAGEARSATFPKPNLKDFRWNDSLGLYEVVANGQVFYVSRNYRYLFVGKIIDISTMRDITSARADSTWTIDYASLDPHDAIRISSGSRSLAIFLDPECPACEKELRELLRLRGVSVYVYLFPLLQVHPAAGHVAETIWCAKDRAKALLDISARVSRPNCETPIERNISFALAHRIDSTPTIILDNGKVLSGFIEASVINRLLETNGDRK